MTIIIARGCRPLMVRADGRASRGRPSGGGTAPGKFEAPARLAGPPNPDNHTAYTLRLSTGTRRGAALTDPASAILVCLMGQDGTALLRRIPVLADPHSDLDDVRSICEGVDDTPPPGADCAIALPAANRRYNSIAHQPPAHRFQEGAVDELSFLGADVGPLAGVFVGPENGTWYCEELDISSSRTGRTERFVCRDELGGNDRPAAMLSPVPPGAVVYGSGDNAVVLTREESSRLREWDMQSYSSLKGRLLTATAALVALGTATSAAAGGAELAAPFALGGFSSMCYQYLLQRRVDGVVLSPTAQASIDVPPSRVEPGVGLTVGRALSNPAVRAGLMAGGLAGSLALMHVFTRGLGLPEFGDVNAEEALVNGGAGFGVAAAYEVRQIAAGLAGFLMQKVAVVWVTLLPDPEDGLEKVMGGGAKARNSNNKASGGSAADEK